MRYVHTTYIYRFVYHIRSMYVSCIYMLTMFDQINRTWYPQQCGSAMTKMKNNRSKKCTEWTEGVVLCNPKTDRCCEVISANTGCVGPRLSQKPSWYDGDTHSGLITGHNMCTRNRPITNIKISKTLTNQFGPTPNGTMDARAVYINLFDRCVVYFPNVSEFNAKS